MLADVNKLLLIEYKKSNILIFLFNKKTNITLSKSKLFSVKKFKNETPSWSNGNLIILDKDVEVIVCDIILKMDNIID